MMNVVYIVDHIIYENNYIVDHYYETRGSILYSNSSL